MKSCHHYNLEKNINIFSELKTGGSFLHEGERLIVISKFLLLN